MQRSLRPIPGAAAHSPLCPRCEGGTGKTKIGAVDVHQGDRLTRVLPLGGVLTSNKSPQPLKSRINIHLVCAAGHRFSLVIEPNPAGQVVLSIQTETWPPPPTAASPAVT
ncbi:MAG TPA: hypothetical protein VM286_02165 [Candidatus Thermoplasmatota archaeon]|nr:hypothetical protein [Candidatus Thermoplasmatota archaeon]